MPDLAPRPKVVRFGDFEADVSLGRLRRRGVAIRVRRQSFEILAVLLENPGEAVTRGELRKRLWPDNVFVDFDNNLNSAMARLRGALNDSAEHPRYIETLPNGGYRFIGRLSMPPAPRPRMVVLPFAHLGGDSAKEYLSDAMTEEIITDLARVAPTQLSVIARTTAMQYKHCQKDIAQIGRELAADYVVEGSVRSGENRIGVNVQLIQVKDQAHLWSSRYDCEWRDFVSTAGLAAEAIAAQLGFTPKHSPRKTSAEPEAYRLYMEGRQQMTKLTADGMAGAKQCFEEAIARDPKFALPYDGVAELYWYLGFLGVMPPRQASSTGVLAAMRALELDNTMAETHALLGWFRKEFDYDWQEVHREMNCAFELNPTSPVVRFRYAKGELLPHGQIDEAIEQIESALESDPLSMDMRHWLGMCLWLGRRYDRAVEEARRELEQDPANVRFHFTLGLCYREKRMFDEAIRSHRTAVQLSGGTPVMLGWLGLALAQSGNAEEANALLDRLYAISSQTYVPPTSFAWIYFGIGDTENAFVWLDRAIEARDHMMTPIKTYPFLDCVRTDPRFIALLRKMNLEPCGGSH